MPEKGCLDLALEAREIRCPECGHIMEIWAWKENIIYRCHECDLMAFRLCGKEGGLMDLEGFALKEKRRKCPLCDAHLVEGDVRGHSLRGCPGCGLVMILDLGKMPVAGDDMVFTRHPPNIIKQEILGRIYEKAVKDLRG